MAMPSDTERENCRKFAKFCFRVIKNECSNIKRAAGIRKDYDATGEEPVEYLLELLSHEDAYTVEDLILNVDGKPCVIESEILFEVLKSLPNDQQKTLLYDFWLELKDREIAERLEVTVRTVYNLRQRAFKKIKTYYELHGQGVIRELSDDLITRAANGEEKALERMTVNGRKQGETFMIYRMLRWKMWWHGFLKRKVLVNWSVSPLIMGKSYREPCFPQKNGWRKIN